MAQENMEDLGGSSEVVSVKRGGSAAWSHFVRSEDGETAICKNCNSILQASSKRNGTSTLNRHIKSCSHKHPRRQQPQPSSVPHHEPPPLTHPPSLVHPPPSRPPSSTFNQPPSLTQPPPSSNITPPQTSLPHPDQRNQQEYCAAELARMIAFHGYSSSMVEDECFISFVRGLNPQFQIPSRAAVEGICNSRAVDSMNQLMATLAGCSGQISLMTDTIETGEGKALYMACQFVDDEWNFQKRIMQVFRLARFPSYNHSALLGAEEVCLQMTDGILKQFLIPMNSSMLKEAVRRWGLPGRLFSVAWGQELDKCLERKDFLDELCPFIQVGEGTIEIPWVVCVTYTCDMLDSVATNLYGTLNPNYERDCFKAVKALHLSHEKRSANFSELGLSRMGGSDKIWYTYYSALEVLHKEYLDNNVALQEQPRLNDNQIVELFTQLTPEEIQNRVRHIIDQPRLKESVFTDLLRKIFGSIYRAIETLSSTSSPTANLCLEELMKLRAILQSELKDASTVIAKAVAYARIGGFVHGKDAHVVLQQVLDGLDNHLKESYVFLCIPAVLDPRFKMDYVANVLNEVYGSAGAPAYISRVKETMEDIFEEHRRKFRRIINGEGTSLMAAVVTGTGGAMDVDSNAEEGITELAHSMSEDLVLQEETESLDAHAVPASGTSSELDTEVNRNEDITELERYLIDGQVSPEEGEGFKVLKWWKDNSSKYPTLASMARDALAMPTSGLLSPEHIARVRSMMSSYCLTYPEAPSDD